MRLDRYGPALAATGRSLATSPALYLAVNSHAIVGAVSDSQILDLPQLDDNATDRSFNARVVVLNDNHNTFEGVAAALARYVPGVDVAQGFKIAEAIHITGSACVWKGPREVAELYWEQLAGCGLTMAPL
jgi:ATP-dependent Clp protease adapter protein ClpS